MIVQDAGLPARWIALIASVGTLVYWNSLDTPFIWDDRTAIINNETIRSLSPFWAPLVTPLETPVSRRPLVNLTFALNYAVNALDVTGYHVVNLAVHLSAACLLFAIVRRTLLLPALRERFAATAAPIALFAAMWWAVHPLVSEVINYTTQRTTAMAGMFFFAALYASQRALSAARPARWRTAAVLACVCGVLAKEVVAVAPLVIVLYDRVFVFDSFRRAASVRRPLYAGLACTWLVLGLLVALRPHSSVGFSAGIDPWTYALNQSGMIVRYLRLVVWPDALVLDYGQPRLLSLSDAQINVLIVSALLAGTLTALIRWPRAGFLCAVFFLTLAPTSSIVPIATEVGAERRMYVPLASLAVLLAIGGAGLLQRLQSRVIPRLRPRARAAGVAVAGVWLVCLAIRTIDRNNEFDSRVSIWQTSVERWPNGRARTSYATALIDAGERESAMRELRIAAPEFPMARFALGNELAAQGRYDEAVRALTTFIAARPQAADRLPARMLRARIRSEQGYTEDAVAEYRELLTLFPSGSGIRQRLADALLAGNRFEEAIAEYHGLLNSQPDGHSWRSRLAMAHAAFADRLLHGGKSAAAAVHAARALSFNPRDPGAHNMLGVALAEQGRLSEAIPHFRESLALDGQNQSARANLAQAERALKASGR